MIQSAPTAKLQRASSTVQMGMAGAGLMTAFRHTSDFVPLEDFDS